MRLSPYFWIDRDIIALGCYDPVQHGAIDRLVGPGMTVLDIGANIGDVTLHLAHRVGVGGRVVAFEPVPGVRDRLSEHVGVNGLDAIVSVRSEALRRRQRFGPLRRGRWWWPQSGPGLSREHRA